MKEDKGRVHVQQKDKVQIAEMVAVYDELDRLREEHPDIAAEINPEYGRKTIIERVLGVYISLRERFHKENIVDRKVYLWLHLLGMFGLHHFYARHWIKGILYIAMSWTGISVGMTLIDWMAAFPQKANGEGKIMI